MSAELTLDDLNAAGRRRYLMLYLCEHVLGPERFGRVLGPARARNRARMRRHFAGRPTDEHRPVPEVRFTSHAEFWRTHPVSLPAVFRGLAREWPAVRRWDLAFFAEHYADTTAVQIDQAGLYGEGEASRYVVSTLGRLVEAIRAGRRECLRFVPIIDDNPELKNDLDMAFLAGFRGPFSLRHFTQFFLAPASTFTPVHAAHESNAFVQIHGTKRWLLWPARYQQLIEPVPDRRPYFHAGYLPGRTSAEPELGAYAPAYEVLLEPGDVLYVPPFVWHYVENVTTTIAAAYRFFSIRHGLRSSRAMMAMKLLATRPSLLHGLFCPRRATDRRCRVQGCPFAIPEAAAA